MARRGVRLVLLAALGLLVWAMAGSDVGRGVAVGQLPAIDRASGVSGAWGTSDTSGFSGASGEAVFGSAAHVVVGADRSGSGDVGLVDEPGVPDPGSLDGRVAGLVRAAHGRTGGALRVLRVLTLAAVLLAAARLHGERRRNHAGDHRLAGWVAWFARPGRLRGPPAI
jgi:hypothetical protein